MLSLLLAMALQPSSFPTLDEGMQRVPVRSVALRRTARRATTTAVVPCQALFYCSSFSRPCSFVLSLSLLSPALSLALSPACCCWMWVDRSQQGKSSTSLASGSSPPQIGSLAPREP